VSLERDRCREEFCAEVLSAGCKLGDSGHGGPDSGNSLGWLVACSLSTYGLGRVRSGCFLLIFKQRKRTRGGDVRGLDAGHQIQKTKSVYSF